MGGFGYAYDRDEFLFLDEIKVGMTGIGKTVVSGIEISEFDVEIIAVIDKPGTYDDFIVARASGEAIDRSGGVAYGMSGSPVYIDGKLIGALSRSYTWQKDPTPIFLITPIEHMLEIIDAVNEQVAVAEEEGFILPEAERTGFDEGSIQEMLDTLSKEDSLSLVFAPLWVSGLSGRALDVLMNGVNVEAIPNGLIGDYISVEIAPEVNGLSSFGLALAPCTGGINSTGANESPPLEPGGAFGVALALGDVDIGSAGTITYRDGDTVVGFGHDFLFNGTVAFPLTEVNIIGTIKTYEASTKYGTLGKPIGAVLEDRWSGIGGAIGVSVDMIDLAYDIANLDSGEARDLAIHLVDEPQIMPELLLSTGFEAIDHALDRLGPGTVSVDYRITGDGMPFPLERHDVFLSTQDVALYPPWQLVFLVTLLQYNAFEDPQIKGIEVNTEITEDLRAMQINHLEIDSDVYQPGDTVHYWVELQTYHGEREIVSGEIAIPSDVEADYVIVRAYSGPRPPEVGEPPKEFKDLGGLIQAIEDLPSYDVLTVEFFVPNLSSPYSEALMPIEKTEREFSGYFLYGEREVSALLGPPTLNVPGKQKR